MSTYISFDTHVGVVSAPKSLLILVKRKDGGCIVRIAGEDSCYKLDKAVYSELLLKLKPEELFNP